MTLSCSSTDFENDSDFRPSRARCCLRFRLCRSIRCVYRLLITCSFPFRRDSYSGQPSVIHITTSKGDSRLIRRPSVAIVRSPNYSPLRHWQAGPGKKVGVVGIGGLGHIGIKLAHAMGAHVVAFTTSEAKREAAKALGADEVVNSRNADEMAAHLKSFDFILNTVAAPHNLEDFTTLLKRDGTMTLVGAPATPHKSPEVFNLIMKRRAIAGSMIGGIPETQEMLDFCAEHGIVADIEMIRADQINEAYERMLRGDVKYRFVIDNRTLTD